MCFVICKNFSEKKVAIEDIIVFKNLNDNLSSECKSYYYKVGKSNPKVELEVINGEINEGYHSWKLPFPGCYKFLIPKGSEYYYTLNHSVQYVSTNIELLSDKPLTEEECIELSNFPTTYQEACEKLGIEPLNESKLLECGLNKKDIAFKKLETIIRCINTRCEIVEYDWDNSKQYKWLGWFFLDSPFRFHVTSYRYTYASAFAGCASRLHLPTEWAVKYVYNINQEFFGYWKEYMR